MRSQAQQQGRAWPALCHLAWGQVVARSSGREQVVFGTVLFGRMHGGAGADRTMGLFINTLPLRLDLDGTGVEASVRTARPAGRAAGARACAPRWRWRNALQRRCGAGAAVQRAVELPPHRASTRLRTGCWAGRRGMAGRGGTHQLSADPVGG
ncbi:condensation domain-containing protein [Bradyrhizobium sp. RDI18]|uniref:condensation domain-containing protein n=1 Tax=Bradyrhizobium sp. RDI18 TaxID=3367400 RepID=UPI0037219C00